MEVFFALAYMLLMLKYFLDEEEKTLTQVLQDPERRRKLNRRMYPYTFGLFCLIGGSGALGFDLLIYIAGGRVILNILGDGETFVPLKKNKIE